MRLVVIFILSLIGLSPALAQSTLSPTPAFFCDFRLASTVSACAITVTRNQAGNTDLLPISSINYAYNTYSANVPRETPGKGILVEESRTNFLLNSTAPVTQTTGSLAIGTYTLWVNEASAGAGSATISSGTAVGCLPTNAVGVPSGTAVATTGTWVNFIITTAGTCTVTVSGSLRTFQLERCGTTVSVLPCFGTSLIITAGATVTRPVDSNMIVSNSDIKNIAFGSTATLYIETDQILNQITANDGFLLSTNTDALFEMSSNSISIATTTLKCLFGASALTLNYGPEPITNVITVGTGTTGTSLVVSAVSNGKIIVGDGNQLFTFTNPGTLQSGTLITAGSGAGGAGTYTTSKPSTVVNGQLLYQLTSGGGWGQAFGTTKAVIGWDSSGRTCQVNGAAPQSDATLKTAGDTILYLGTGGNSTRAIDGYVRIFQGWGSRLTNAQLMYLSQQVQTVFVDSASSSQILNSGTVVPPIVPTVHQTTGPNYNSAVPPANIAAIAKQVDADAVRLEMQWQAAEKVLGVYDFSTVDPFAAAYLAQGIKLHMLFSYGNNLYNSCGSGKFFFCTTGNVFTATGSGTDLTITGLTGTIVPNDGNIILSLVAGIPANTHIIAQQSGTTGSNGVYTTDNAITITAGQVSQPLAAVNTGYANFAAAASKHYDDLSVAAGMGHLLVAELSNEVNCNYATTSPSAINYAYQLVSAAAAIKAIAPSVPIASAGLGICGVNVQTYIASVIANSSTLTNVDAFGNHPYQTQYTPEPVITPTQAFSGATLNIKPQWNTEQGYSAFNTLQNITEVTRAYYTSRLLLMELASGVSEISWYALADGGGNNPGFGLFVNTSTGAFTAAPSATAFTLTKAAMKNATNWNIKYFQNSDTYQATFTNSLGTNTIVWSPSASVNFIYNAPSLSSITFNDVLGFPITASQNGSAYTVPLGQGNPVIITLLN